MWKCPVFTDFRANRPKLRKLCVSAKCTHQKIRWKYSILCNAEYLDRIQQLVHKHSIPTLFSLPGYRWQRSHKPISAFTWSLLDACLTFNRHHLGIAIADIIMQNDNNIHRCEMICKISRIPFMVAVFSWYVDVIYFEFLKKESLINKGSRWIWQSGSVVR